MSNIIKIAIDPGWSGALVYINIGNKIISFNCPSDQRGMVDMYRGIKKEIPQDTEVRALIEQVNVRPTDGRKSLWSFATNYATHITLLIAFRFPYKLVNPKVWQQFIGCLPADKAARKNRIKEYVQGLYPDLSVTLKNADALGILAHHDQLWTNQ